MKIHYSPLFERAYRKLSPDIKERVKSREETFRTHPFHMGLKTHKLHGRMKNLWAFSITHKYRIIFEFIDENTVRFNYIGTHDIYD